MNRIAPRTRAGLGARLAVVATVLGSTLLGLVVAEIGLRVAGHRPPAQEEKPFPNEPTLNVPDPVLGWRPKTGVFRFPGYTPSAPPITMTFWPDGSRATRAAYVARDRRVVLIGDSFTEGWAVSDDETYAWKLAQRFPDVEFLNYGTAGYNGLQALLRLEEHLDARPSPPPALVVYGFNSDQERRNVADGNWLRMLAKSSSRGTVELPYGSLDATGGLVRHAPEGYPSWPLRDRLASVFLLEGSWFTFTVRNRHAQARPVTERLIDEMNRVVRARGSRLLVAILAGTSDVRVHYRLHLMTHAIEWVDCTHAERLIVPGEGHPNGAAHTKWAECLARVIDADLAPAHGGAGVTRP